MSRPAPRSIAVTHGPRATQGGIALVLVLWVIALLTTMAAAVVMTARTDVYLAHNRVAEARIRALSEAAITLVALRLRFPEDSDRWWPDGTLHPWVFAGQGLEIRLYNEGSRIDLNGAPNTLLAGLLRAVGVAAADAERLSTAIVDWRDPDDEAQFQGAESGEYHAAGLPYGSKNAPFASTEELRLVLGFTPELVRALADHVTVNGNGGAVLQEYADPVVLAALDVPPPVAAPSEEHRSLGGPVYRIQVRALDGGPTLEALFRLGGPGGAQTTLLWRRFAWSRQPAE